MELAAQQRNIEVTKQLLRAVNDLAVFVTLAVKRGWRTSDMFMLFQLGSAIFSIINQGRDLLPEWKDIDQKEAGQLAEQVYKIVKDVYDNAVSVKQ